MAGVFLVKKEFTMRAFMLYKYGADKTHVWSATPNPNNPKFGQLIVEDLPLMKTASSSGTSLGCVRGLDIQPNRKAISWQIYHHIIFHDQHEGSSLTYTPSWSQVAIVGGTGEFTMAQGVVYGTKIPSGEPGIEIIELYIRAYYTPMDMPAMLD
ncbi:unnamed protein product [Urochloa decumbens]|uniref:Dirigent protein n=1 Tax=Urochloa decumbens TaxID=240449 RepID=A0ABC9G8U6_9POAL